MSNIPEGWTTNRGVCETYIISGSESINFKNKPNAKVSTSYYKNINTEEEWRTEFSQGVKYYNKAFKGTWIGWRKIEEGSNENT